jgi:tetratricopeptide (TPR) repeat protein
MNRIVHKIVVTLVCIGWAMAGAGRPAEAQATAARDPLMLVTSFGPGSIALPLSADWKPELLTVYESGKRPMAQFSNDRIKTGVSFLLFENRSGTATAQGCREDSISPIVKKYGTVIYKRSDKTSKLAEGVEIATTAYTLEMDGAKGTRQRNLFAFAGNATTCAEAHLSSTVDTPEEAAQMQGALKEFHPNLAYTPAAIDLYRIGQLLFKREPGLAVPYFKASLNAMPADTGYSTPRRITTDQLAMALGLSGDWKGSREVAEKAVAADPDYPMNYYNLACADAEQGDTVNARKHLQDAFDRRKNLVPGASMPDASKNDSILKLKKDDAFWEFVTSLPKG